MKSGNLQCECGCEEYNIFLNEEQSLTIKCTECGKEMLLAWVMRHYGDDADV